LWYISIRFPGKHTAVELGQYFCLFFICLVRKANIQMEKEIAENAKVNLKKFW
jgi:hypothetical protein